MKPLFNFLIASTLLISGCTQSETPNTSKTITTKPPASQSAITVPYTLPHGYQTVDVMINGQGPFPFVFDTGAGDTMITSALKDTLQLDISGKDIASSPAGGQSFEVEQVTIATIGLNEAKVHDLQASVIDFGPPGISGVIGPSMFKDFGRVSIDFLSREINIGGTTQIWPNKTWIPFGDNAPLLDLTLTIGNAQIPAHIDSGQPGGLALPIKYKSQLPLSGPVKVVGKARTVDREFEIYSAPIEQSIQLGDATLTLTEVNLFDVPYANIGHKALENLYLEIDWKNERFAIR